MKRNLIVRAVVYVVMSFTGLMPLHALAAPQTSSDVKSVADVTFTLRTDIADGKLVFVGMAGAIKDQINPDLRVAEGAVVQINLVNGDGAQHDISLPDFNAASNKLNEKGASTAIVFRANKSGEFRYICSLPGLGSMYTLLSRLRAARAFNRASFGKVRDLPAPRPASTFSSKIGVGGEDGPA